MRMRRGKRKEGHDVMWLRLMVTQKGGGGGGGCDPRVDTRGIHRRGGLTIDNRRCISFDLPNIAKKPHSTLWTYTWLNLGTPAEG